MSQSPLEDVIAHWSKLVEGLSTTALGFSWLFAPRTYYRLDTAIMLRSAVHAAVLEVIDGLMTQKGLRALSESDRKPVFRELVLGEPEAAVR